MIPGEINNGNETIVLNSGRETKKLQVTNTGEYPIQITSHFHFFEVNKDLEFDRQKAYGFRLNIPAGSAVRFEAHETVTVNLVQYGGHQEVWGFNNLANGQCVGDCPAEKLSEAKARGFRGA